MPQAKTLSEIELKRVLATVAAGRNASRNRAMMLLSHWSGMRVGEISSLKLGDILDVDGSVRDEIRLTSAQTKGDRGRSVLLPDKLRKELAAYIKTLKRMEREAPFFRSQKRREGFSPNTLCQLFKSIYIKAGLEGATSHSGRRTFITKLATQGVGVRVLMSLAGHRHIGTTQRYIDLNDDMKRAAISLI